MWSFLWPSIWVRGLLVDICSFRVLVVVNFLNQNPCIPLWPGVFKFVFLVSVLVNIWVFPLSILFRVLLTFSPCCLFIQLFLECSLGCHILLENCSASLASVTPILSHGVNCNVISGPGVHVTPYPNPRGRRHPQDRLLVLYGPVLQV